MINCDNKPGYIQMRYNPNLHTPETRESQLAEIGERHPEAVIVGSVGRAAILGYDLPVNKGLFGREARDIDLTATTGRLIPIVEADRRPFPAENALKQLIRSDSARSFTTVFFDPSRPDISVELPSVVFEPFETKVGSININTFHPDTLRRLHLICNSKRRKDRESIPEFERALEATDYPRLPDEYFEPLTELRELVANDSELRHQYRNERLLTLYGTYVPAPVRDVLRPIARPLRKAAGVIGRDEEEVPQSPPLADQ